MDERRLKRETERAVRKVLRHAQRYETIGKQEFAAILDQVIVQVRRNTGLDLSVIGQQTQTVLHDLPHEYGQLPEATRSWEALIAYLYAKYLKELGVLGD
jgi:hypothetical protein